MRPSALTIGYVIEKIIAALLPDVYAVQGMKIVLSGTNSLGFWLAQNIQHSLKCYDWGNHFEIHLELKKSLNLQNFVSTIRKLGLTIDAIEMNPAYANSGLSVYSISISISSQELKKYKTHKEIIEVLSTLDYIYHIEEI